MVQTVIKAIGDLKMASHDDWGREQCRLLGIVHRYTKTSKCEWYRGGQDSRRHCLLNRPDIGSPRFYSVLLPTGGWWCWGWTKGYLYIDILTQCSTLILIFDRPLFIARSSSVADNTWDIMSILFYESRKQNDNSTMNFNDQLLSCSFFLLPYRVGYSNGILQIDGGSSSANGAKTSSGSSQILRVSPQTLVYLELSPDFCRANITAGMFRFPNLIQMPFLRCVHIYKLEIFFFFRNKRNER